MKKLVLITLSVLAMASGVKVSAQGKFGADSAECVKYLSYYKEYYKQGNNEQALPNWRKAFSICPGSANQNMLLDGAVLLRKEIQKNRNNSMVKEGLIDTLMMVHTRRADNFPKYAVTALNNKGTDMINYMQDEPEALYKGLKEIIAANGTASKPQLFLFNLNSAVALYKSGMLDAETVIEDYEIAMSTLDEIAKSSEKESDIANVEKSKSAVEEVFIGSKVASCDNLIALFTPRFEADPDNQELVTKIVTMMGNTEDCLDNDLFLAAIEKKAKFDPSYKTSYMLYKLYASRNDYALASQYLEDAIKFDESDVETDAKYYYELSAYSIKNGKYVKAVDSALKAAELDASLAGKCYMICGNAWMAVTSGGDYIAKRAPYWVAADYFTKAKNADESLAEEANRQISTCSRYFPETGEAFMYGVQNGQTYRATAGGLSATTTVRTQK
ncbi:MAG: hypothetical protein MJZ07_00975 [Bacteroidales bacterium]|nr:hypothetical protein [Bacteroidales bacterium]